MELKAVVILENSTNIYIKVDGDTEMELREKLSIEISKAEEKFKSKIKELKVLPYDYR